MVIFLAVLVVFLIVVMFQTANNTNSRISVNESALKVLYVENAYLKRLIKKEITVSSEYEFLKTDIYYTPHDEIKQ